MEPRGFGTGRLHKPDPRDGEHLMASHLPDDLGPLPPRRRRWSLPPLMDQGRTSQCVAYSSCHLLGATPVPRPLPGGWPHDLYRRSQARDGFPLPHDGTTVRAGMGVLLEEGYVGEYVWARSIEEAAHWNLRRGPVVAGTVWTMAMYDVRSADDFVVPGGRPDGGHAYLLFGVDVPGQFFWVANSWGPRWGGDGIAKIRFGDLRALFQQDGELCTAVEKRPRRVRA